ncbi:MAG: hypothetical protein HY319_15950 [Armatimonadetes bacterium]|nr:hypothetical protein [Armatimonadota bacterium]
MLNYHLLQDFAAVELLPADPRWHGHRFYQLKHPDGFAWTIQLPDRVLAPRGIEWTNDAAVERFWLKEIAPRVDSWWANPQRPHTTTGEARLVVQNNGETDSKNIPYYSYLLLNVKEFRDY